MTVTPDFRCSMLSLADGEPMAGSALPDPEFLLVEAPGPWGHDALADNRLPDAVAGHLRSLPVRVQLIRLLRGEVSGGTRVFHARRDGAGFEVRTALLDGPQDLLTLDLSDPDALEPHHGPLWFVCTNSRRDRCCALDGRPVAAALSERWPDATWEVNHLGGHRFAGTLLALPSGWMLGRLDGLGAVEACESLLHGTVPLELSRGRAGRPGAEQVRELHVLSGGSPDVEVVAHPGPLRQLSCGTGVEKPTVRYEIRDLTSSSVSP